MGNVDREFVEKLEVFTESLGDVVELLKSKVDDKETDVTNGMLKNMPDRLTEIAEELKTVKEDVSDIKTTTDDIKKSVDDLKTQKETGLFGRISSDDNKEKIKEGVSTIVLIAGGVMALGAAFKIVGDVDYGTVLALSTSMVALSYAFSKIYDTMRDSKIGYRDVIFISSILPIMSVGLALSSFILSKSSEINLEKSISIIFTAGTLGVSLFLMSKALKDFDSSESYKYLFLPVILPAIAGGIYLSSLLLSKTPTIGLNQALSLVIVSGALGVSLFLMSKTLSSMDIKEGNIKNFLLLPVILPAIATGIFLSSHILKYTASIGWDEAINIGVTSLAIGIGSLAMIPTLVAIGKFKLKYGDILKAGLAVVLISGIIVASAFILQEGSDLIGGFDSDKVPDYEWSLKVGLSMIVFGGATAALGALMMTGLGAGALALGAVAVLGVAGMMIGVAKILDMYDWNNTKYPSLEWSKGVGLSLMGFSLAIMMAGPSAVLNNVFELLGADPPLINIANSMIDVAKVLDKYNWGGMNYPSLEWSESVGKSLMGFSVAMIASAPGSLMGKAFKLFGADPPLIDIAKMMKKVAIELDEISWSNMGYPTEDWAKGVGTAMTRFAEMQLMMDGGDRLNKVVSWITGDDSKSEALEGIAKQMINIAGVMNDPIWGSDLKYPKPEWSKGVGDALFSFSRTFKILDDVSIDNDEFEEESILLVNGLKAVASHMEGQDWSNLPDTSGIKTWSDGVVKGISSFIGLLEKIDNSSYGRVDRKGLEYLVKSMSIINNEIKDIDFNSNIPEEWGKNIKRGIIPIIDILETIDESDYGGGDRRGLVKLVGSMNDISEEINGSNYNDLADWGESMSSFALSISKIPNNLYSRASQLSSSLNKLSEIETEDTIKHLAESIKYLSESLDGLNTNTIDKLNGLANSTLVMSLVDSAKLEEFVSTLDEKKGDISDIISLGNMMSSQEESTEIPTNDVVYTKTNSDKTTSEDKEKFESLMKQLTTMTDYLSKMLNIKHMDTPSRLSYEGWAKSKYDDFD